MVNYPSSRMEMVNYPLTQSYREMVEFLAVNYPLTLGSMGLQGDLRDKSFGLNR